MGTALYAHNQTAYEAALSLLEKTGKAAVIHPTGTGKSFIAMKLCEEHPNDSVCWLSPSEYIFQTQTENWRAAGGRGAVKHPIPHVRKAHADGGSRACQARAALRDTG